ncbi:hypothetical protein C8F04DRAFT_1305975 [Mycena alexandri]|uniref:DUF6534 domain-containing protein n=1 Tax=Mycena alexandri TaxID=1745969 RepID=A0AAD6T7U4_9AGAR|nr:hypothetical protein C8F04DRAFT_1305975 [Mycena alexandri]
MANPLFIPPNSSSWMQTNIDNTFGLLFIVAIVSACLYGVGILQFWLYIRKYHSRDGLVLKLLVIAVMVCDTFQQGLLCHAVYKYLGIPLHIPSYDQITRLTVSSISDRAILPTVVKFYCWRILKVFDLLGVNYHYSGMKLATFEELLSLRPLSIAGNIIYAVADMTISAVLIILLYSAKTAGLFKRTTDLINRLIAAFSNTFLYSLLFLGNNPASHFTTKEGRFYTNSLLVTLNCREYIANELGNGEAYSINLEKSKSPRGVCAQATNTMKLTEGQLERELLVRNKESNHSRDVESDSQLYPWFNSI